MVEHDVTHVGQVDALAEGRGRDHDAQRALAKEAFDLQALGIGHLPVIEHHLVAQLGAQLPCDLGDLAARVAVDDALLAAPVARSEEIAEIRDLVFGAAGVGYVEVRAHGRVDHPGVDAQILDDAGEGVVAGGRGEREHLRRAERSDRRREARVRRTVARLVQVVRLVDHDERRRAAAAQRVAVKLEELRRREDDVPRAVAQRREQLRALQRLD